MYVFRFSFKIQQSVFSVTPARQILKIAGTSKQLSQTLQFSCCSPVCAKTPRKMPEARSETSSPVAKEARIEETKQPSLRFAKLTQNALTPTRGSKQAAGFDLYR